MSMEGQVKEVAVNKRIKLGGPQRPSESKARTPSGAFSICCNHGVVDVISSNGVGRDRKFQITYLLRAEFIERPSVVVFDGDVIHSEHPADTQPHHR